MKNFALVAALIVASVVPAFATHNHPQQAKLLKTALASAYDQCVIPGATHKPSISLPACNPEILSTTTTAANQITFGPLGKMAVGIKVIPGDLKIAAKGKDILNNSLPYTGTLTFTTTVRITDHGCLPPIFPNPCTVQDFALTVPINCAAGACAASTSVNTLTPGTITALDEMNIELGQITVLDPDGDDAFRQGVFVP